MDRLDILQGLQGHNQNSHHHRLHKQLTVKYMHQNRKSKQQYLLGHMFCIQYYILILHQIHQVYILTQLYHMKSLLLSKYSFHNLINIITLRQDQHNWSNNKEYLLILLYTQIHQNNSLEGSLCKQQHFLSKMYMKNHKEHKLWN